MFLKERVNPSRQASCARSETYNLTRSESFDREGFALCFSKTLHVIAAFGCYEVKRIAAVPTLCKSCGCKFCCSEKL